MFNEKLKERFFNTYKFSNHDNNKFILLLRKGVYPKKDFDKKIRRTSWFVYSEWYIVVSWYIWEF